MISLPVKQVSVNFPVFHQKDPNELLTVRFFPLKQEEKNFVMNGLLGDLQFEPTLTVCILMWFVNVELCLNSRLHTWHSAKRSKRISMRFDGDWGRLSY